MNEVPDGNYRFTTRMQKIICRAKEYHPLQVIYPLHLLLATAKETSGISGELDLYLREKQGEDFRSFLLNESRKEKEETYCLENNMNVSTSTLYVLKEAKKVMTYYKQSFINEGHILKVTLDKLEGLPLEEEIKNGIKDIACVPRDLIVPLKNWQKVIIESNDSFKVERAKIRDEEELKAFISREFDERWLKPVIEAFNKMPDIPIYIARKNQYIVGFACYDTDRNKKGVLGPMGISRNIRTKGIGKQLLHTCLYEMEKIGYDYAIIGQAGPIEFYEKSCGAKVVPIFK